ncbi:MAG: L,D-transpeptidase family protein [Pseudomonadota bacterium]
MVSRKLMEHSMVRDWRAVLAVGAATGIVLATTAIGAQAQTALNTTSDTSSGSPVVDYDLQDVPPTVADAPKPGRSVETWTGDTPSGSPKVAYDAAPTLNDDVPAELPPVEFASPSPVAPVETVSPAETAPTSTPQTVETAAPSSPTADDRAVAAKLAQTLTEEGFGKSTQRYATNDADDRKALAAFYASDVGRPLFVRDGALSSSGRKLIETLKTASDWGLDAGAFAIDLPETGLTTQHEITLSLAALKYARHARGGRIANPTKDLSSYLDKKPQLIAPETVVDQLAQSSDLGVYLTSLHPKHLAFQNLRKALLKLREGAKATEQVVEIPTSGPLLSEGKSHPHVALIRERLGVIVPTAEDGAAGDPNTFDASLKAALKAFQKQNGLSADGVVGRRTRAAFSGGPRQVTEEMLVANMELWRWMPDELGPLHVISNIPQYNVQVINRDQIIHEERVIVGKINKQTPVFSDVMEKIVFNPMWGVPNSIKVKELLPSLARGGNSFQRQNLKISYKGRSVDPRSINWAQADIRNYHVYQPPGRGNVLGVVKFRFPNKHAVYMHDTPTKPLFNKRKRTYSHGCVRVRNPMKLAEILLDADRSWSAKRVASMVGGSRENTVNLNTHIPVHMVYQTAVADADGEVTTFADIYKHERRIRLALAGDWKKMPRHRDHMLPVRIDRAKIDRLVRNNQYQQNPVNNIFEAIFGF